MANIITRRSILAAGTGAAVLGVGGKAFAQSRIETAPATAPTLPIENGATLRMLRPVRFVQPDEDVFRANCARFTQQTGVLFRFIFRRPPGTTL